MKCIRCLIELSDNMHLAIIAFSRSFLQADNLYYKCAAHAHTGQIQQLAMQGSPGI